MHFSNKSENFGKDTGFNLLINVMKDPEKLNKAGFMLNSILLNDYIKNKTYTFLEILLGYKQTCHIEK